MADSRDRLPPDRCPRCEMLDYLCLCSALPQLKLSTGVQVIIHSSERFRTTNSGRLAALSIEGCELHLHGRFSGEPLNIDQILSDPRPPYVLYPDAASETLDRDFVKALPGPINLIILDGTWQQTRRMSRRIPRILELPRVKLETVPVSEYLLRRQRRAGGLSTLEAIAAALRLLEGEPVYQELMQLFRVMVSRMLYTKGRVAAEAVYGGLPHLVRHPLRTSPKQIS